MRSIETPLKKEEFYKAIDEMPNHYVIFSQEERVWVYEKDDFLYFIPYRCVNLITPIITDEGEISYTRPVIIDKKGIEVYDNRTQSNIIIPDYWISIIQKKSLEKIRIKTNI